MYSVAFFVLQILNMKKTLIFSSIILITTIAEINSQSLFNTSSQNNGIDLGGFTRSGIFLNKPGDDIGLPVSFADLSLKAEAGDNVNYGAYADLRYRYAGEYGKSTDKLVLREAWAAWYTSYSELKAGKQVIKWSRMDFFSLQDMISPRNDLYRSFDPSDKDLANISISLSLNPSENISIETVLIPSYRPSVLYTGFMDMPSPVEIKAINANDYSSVSYGARASFFFRNFSAGISYFDGYNLLPGIGIDSVIISNGSPALMLEEKTYKTRALGADFEILLGKNIIRAEGSWSDPENDYREKEYVRLPDIQWTAGIERYFGDFRVIAEYSGKYLLDYAKPAAEPGFPDESSFQQIFSLPPAQISELSRQQLASFNRLYNYQVEENSHYAGISLGWEKSNALFKPSLSVLYNITAGEYMLYPVLETEPADNIDIILGAEIYNGVSNSVFDMINDRLNSVFAGVRVDF